MKNDSPVFLVLIGISVVFSTLSADECDTGDVFASESIEYFNHEGYQDASMEDGCELPKSFDVAECDAAEGCNIMDAAAAKAAFASERYLQASEAFSSAATIYEENGYADTARLCEEAAKVAESGHLAFQSLSAFNASGFEEMNVDNYEDLKELFLHVDPIYLDASKSGAIALASIVLTEFYVREIIEASAYQHSATAAAFRAYQFFYAGIETAEPAKSKDNQVSWFWRMLGY